MNANLPPRNLLALVAVVLLLCVSAGCSKEDLKQAYADAKSKTEEIAAKTKESVDTAVNSTVTAIEDALPAAGSMTVRGSMPIENTGKANVEVIVIGDGRPNVLQVLSYEADQESMTYPAVLLHGPTDADSAKSLVGSSVNCDLYLQATAGGPIVMTKPGAHVVVTFSQFNLEDNTISASIAGGDVISSDETTAQFLGGELTAVVRD